MSHDRDIRSRLLFARHIQRVESLVAEGEIVHLRDQDILTEVGLFEVALREIVGGQSGALVDDLHIDSVQVGCQVDRVLIGVLVVAAEVGRHIIRLIHLLQRHEHILRRTVRLSAFAQTRAEPVRLAKHSSIGGRLTILRHPLGEEYLQFAEIRALDAHACVARSVYGDLLLYIVLGLGVVLRVGCCVALFRKECSRFIGRQTNAGFYEQEVVRRSFFHFLVLLNRAFHEPVVVACSH